MRSLGAKEVSLVIRTQSLSPSTWPKRLILTAVAWYLRHTPILKGRWRLVREFLPQLRAVGRSMGERVITTRHGFVMKLDLGEWICQNIYLTGSYEHSITELVSSLLRSGDTMIDVGANIGFFTLLASGKVGDSGTVHAFEPVPSTTAALNANLVRNGSANVVVHDCALSNSTGTVTIYEGPARNRGNSSIRPIADASAECSVPMVSFDSLEASKGPIHLIKIDVEGAEQLVIEGMLQCLRRTRPHLIIEMTEQFLRHFEHSPSSLAGLLRPLGYEMYEITDKGLVRLGNEATAWPRQFNAYCSPQPAS